MREVEKRLEEIERKWQFRQIVEIPEDGIDALWGCARLRDALLLVDVLEKRLWNKATDEEVDASAAARRRLFGEEESRG